jgi:anti-sigma B factor antagonist
VHDNDAVRILTLTGPLDMRSLFDFQDIARQETEKSVIVDLTSVPYMDSAGLGSVISIFANCQRTGRGFALCGLSSRLRTLLEVTHVAELMPQFETAAAAEAAVSKP